MYGAHGGHPVNLSSTFLFTFFVQEFQHFSHTTDGKMITADSSTILSSVSNTLLGAQIKGGNSNKINKQSMNRHHWTATDNNTASSIGRQQSMILDEFDDFQDFLQACYHSVLLCDWLRGCAQIAHPKIKLTELEKAIFGQPFK